MYLKKKCLKKLNQIVSKHQTPKKITQRKTYALLFRSVYVLLCMSLVMTDKLCHHDTAVLYIAKGRPT